MASVYLKGPTWYADIKDESGGRRQVALRSAKTKTDARRAADDLERRAERRRLGQEAMPADSTMTLGELVEWWLRERCPEASLKREESRLRRHVIGHVVAATPLSMLRTPHLTQHLAALERQPSPKLSAASLNHIRKDLHRVFSQARRVELWVGPNPVAEVPRHKVARKAPRVTLRPEEVPLLLAQVPTLWRAFFATALYTGMRKGELCGLRKRDVDLDRRELVVGRSYERQTTKGGHVDVLPIADPLLPILRQAVEASPIDHVFTSADGEPLTEHARVRKIFRAALRAANLVDDWRHICRRCKSRGERAHEWRLPDGDERRCPTCKALLWPSAIPRAMNFHSLRHTTATLLLRAGVDAHRVQRILRHRDVRTTTATYGHLLIDDLRSAVATLPHLPSDEPPRPTRFLPDGEQRARRPDGETRKGSENRGLPQRAQRDSNPRPSASKADALPFMCARRRSAAGRLRQA